MEFLTHMPLTSSRRALVENWSVVPITMWAIVAEPSSNLEMTEAVDSIYMLSVLYIL